MNKYIKAAITGSLEGIRETPRLYFAPVIAFFKWMYRVAEQARQEQHKRN